MLSDPDKLRLLKREMLRREGGRYEQKKKKQKGREGRQQKVVRYETVVHYNFCQR